MKAKAMKQEEYLEPMKRIKARCHRKDNIK